MAVGLTGCIVVQSAEEMLKCCFNIDCVHFRICVKRGIYAERCIESG